MNIDLSLLSIADYTSFIQSSVAGDTKTFMEYVNKATPDEDMFERPMTDFSYVMKRMAEEITKAHSPGMYILSQAPTSEDE